MISNNIFVGSTKKKEQKVIKVLRMKMKRYNIIFRQYFPLYEELRRFYRKFKTARQIIYIIILKQVQGK